MKAFTEREFTLLKEMFERGQIATLAKTVRSKTLYPTQTLVVAYALIMKRAVLAPDTGMGKTLIATAIMNTIRAQRPAFKWVFICKSDALDEIYLKIASGVYDSNVICTDATSDSLLRTFFTRRAISADILVLTYEAVCSRAAEEFLFRNRGQYRGVILDEGHLMSNLTSHQSRLISAIMNTAEYRFVLTATPLRINIDQVLNEIYMIDRDFFEGVDLKTFSNRYKVWENGQVVGYKNLEELSKLLLPRLYSVTRASEGIAGEHHVSVELVPPSDNYENHGLQHHLKSIKGDSQGPALVRLCEVVRQHIECGRKGLIYVDTNKNKALVRNYLREAGIECDIRDGHFTPSRRQKAEVIDRFRKGEFSALITNSSVSLDIPCDFIIFYELTFDFKQVIGRGERGWEGRELYISFILVDESYDIPFFYHNVYERGLLLETVCSKDVPELKEAVKQLEARLQIKELLEED